MVLLGGLWLLILLSALVREKIWSITERTLSHIKFSRLKRLWLSIPKEALKITSFMAICGFFVFTIYLPNYSSLKPWLLPITYSMLICVVTWMILSLYEKYSDYGSSLDGRQKEYFMSCVKRARRRIAFLVGTSSLILLYYFDSDSRLPSRKTVALGILLVLMFIFSIWND